MPAKKEFERLPTNVVPKHYVLTLTPNLNKFVFSGTQTVTIKINNPTNTIVMNSLGIRVTKASIILGEGQQDVLEAKVTYSIMDETVTLTFPSKLPATPSVKLRMDFKGELNDKMKGFYRTRYSTPDGEMRYAAVTQFEATDARRAFPCWDEPGVKATFDVTLRVPKDRVALSNMPVMREEKTPTQPDLKDVVFATTPVMSTYLLAFIVGEFDYVETEAKGGVIVRVYTPVGKKEQGVFAMEVAAKTLPFYSDYFRISYPLPKIDLIAIPDFAAGAMENWGLITYREAALLVDAQNSSTNTRQWVSLIVGHELAHQWFGNLVTMEWWTHLWLNEGFASWIEYLCVDHCFPKFDIWTQFVFTDYSRALDLDALKNSHPIEVPVGHPSEIDEIFDAISYSKGASVIRMLHTWIGDKDFRTGMHDYLSKFQYSNASTEDLWASLGKASGKPVQDVMSKWTSQLGFPVLKVESTQAGGDTTQLKISQEKFCADGKYEGTDSPWWPVPVTISTQSSPDAPVETFLLDNKPKDVVLDLPNGQWFKLNAGTVGLYRTQYQPEMLGLLLPAIEDMTLPPRDRLGIQSDLYALSQAGLTNTAEFLRVLKSYKNETNYTVWCDVSANLAALSKVLQYTDYYPKVQEYTRLLFKNIAEKLGWEPTPGESDLDAMLRGVALSALGRHGDEDVIKEANKRFAGLAEGTGRVPPDLRSAIYTTVITHGGRKEVDQLLKMLKAVELTEEKVRMYRSLGAVKDKDLIEEVLKFSISDQVRNQDTMFVLGSVVGTKLGRECCWEFVKANWKMFNERYGGGFILSRIVKVSTEDFASEEKAAEVEKFFAENPTPAAERAVQQSVETIRLKEKWLTRDKASIRAFLESAL